MRLGSVNSGFWEDTPFQNVFPIVGEEDKLSSVQSNSISVDQMLGQEAVEKRPNEAHAKQILKNLKACEVRTLKVLEELQEMKAQANTQSHQIECLNWVVAEKDRNSKETRKIKEDLDLLKIEMAKQKARSLKELESSKSLTLAEKVSIVALLAAPMLLPALGRGVAAYADLDPCTTFAKEFCQFNLVDLTASAMQLSQIFYHGFRAGLPGIQEFAENIMPQQAMWIGATALWHSIAVIGMNNAHFQRWGCSIT